MNPPVSESSRLVYVHDPMCSWCWGFRPVFERLRTRLPEGIAVNRLLGGLAPDTDLPMPAEMRHRLEDTWHRIEQRIPGTRFNFDFWLQCHPRRSTWPACRAVIAARAMDPASEEAMISAIQQAYYLEARNPSDLSTLAALAHEVGLDQREFEQRIDSIQTHARLQLEIAEARSLGADSFPSLRLLHRGRSRPVPVHYTEVEPMLEVVRTLIGT